MTNRYLMTLPGHLSPHLLFHCRLVFCGDLGGVIDDDDGDLTLTAFDLQTQLLLERSLPRGKRIGTQLGPDVHTEFVDPFEASLVQDRDRGTAGLDRYVW